MKFQKPLVMFLSLVHYDVDHSTEVIHSIAQQSVMVKLTRGLPRLKHNDFMLVWMRRRRGQLYT